MVMHEVKPGWTITKEWEGYTIDADIAFKDIREEEYLGIFFSGGRAPEYIREDKDLIRITQHFFDTEQADRQRLSRRRNPGPGRSRPRPADGDRREVQIRPRSLRRHLRQRALRHRRQPRQRPDVSRPRQLRGAVDQDADRGAGKEVGVQPSGCSNVASD